MDRLTELELAEWMVYYSLEPWGPERGDLNAGIIASTIANVNRGKSSKSYSPKDFMPEYGGPQDKKELSEAARVRAVMRGIKERLDNKKKRRKINGEDEDANTL